MQLTIRIQNSKNSNVSNFLFPSQFDRTKKPSVRVSDEPKPSQNGSAKDSTQNGPVVPDRSVKPSFTSNSSLSKEEQSQIHSEAVAVMEKARQEQEKRNQLRRLGEERHEKEEKELKERQEREERDKQRKEEDEKGHQEKKKLERQKAEEEEDKENRGEERDRRGKEQSSDTPTKSMSLDSPAPNHIVSEIKVSFFFHEAHQYFNVKVEIASILKGCT